MGQTRRPPPQHIPNSPRTRGMYFRQHLLSIDRQAGSHSKRGWDTFTAAVIKAVVDRLSPETNSEAGANGVCFMAWGAHASKMIAGVNEVRVDTYLADWLEKAFDPPFGSPFTAVGKKRFHWQRAFQEEQ